MAVTKSWSLCLLILEETKKRCKVYKGKMDLVDWWSSVFWHSCKNRWISHFGFLLSAYFGCFIFSAGPMSLLPMFCATSLRSGNMEQCLTCSHQIPWKRYIIIAYGQETRASADATTFATALHVLGTAGQWRRCLEILQQMQVGVVGIPG